MAWLADLLATPQVLAYLQRYVAAHEAQAAALTRLADLKERELGLDPASVQMAVDTALRVPDVSITYEADRELTAAMQEVATTLLTQRGSIPSEEEVIAEYDRQVEAGLRPALG